MPILGDLNSTNQLYLKNIREILDEDKRINKIVNDMTIKQVATFSQTVVPQNTLLNKATVDNMDALVAAFNKKAEEMNNTLKILEATENRESGKVVDLSKYKDVIEVFDIINYYNNIVSLVKSPTLSQAEKSMAENKAMQILPSVDTLRLNYKRWIIQLNNQLYNKYYKSPAGEQLFIPEMVSVYSLLNLMSSNLNSKNYSVITLSDVQNIYSKTVINEFPTLKTTNDILTRLKKFNLPFIEQQYKIFEEDYGRKPTDIEKERIIKQYTGKYEPIFSDRTVNLLEKYADMKQQIADLHEVGRDIPLDEELEYESILKSEKSEKEDAHIKEMINYIRLNNRKRDPAIKKQVADYKEEVKRLQGLKKAAAPVALEGTEGVLEGAPVAEGNGKKGRKVYLQHKRRMDTEFDDSKNESYAY